MFDRNDIEQNKNIVLITAIFQCVPGLSILFFLPLICCKDSEFGKFYANQGLLIFIIDVILGIVAGVLALIPIIRLLSTLVFIPKILLALLNAYNVYKEEKKELPYIGHITLIK